MNGPSADELVANSQECGSSIGQSGCTLSGNTGASTRFPLNVEISARMPLRDFLVSALFSVQPLAPLHLPMVRAEVPVQVQRCLCSLPQ